MGPWFECGLYWCHIRLISIPNWGPCWGTIGSTLDSGARVQVSRLKELMLSGLGMLSGFSRVLMWNHDAL